MIEGVNGDEGIEEKEKEGKIMRETEKNVQRNNIWKRREKNYARLRKLI